MQLLIKEPFAKLASDDEIWNFWPKFENFENRYTPESKRFEKFSKCGQKNGFQPEWSFAKGSKLR